MKPPLFIIALALAMPSCAHRSSFSTSPHSTSAETARDLTIATYNIYVGNRDLKQSVAVIRKMNADVVALQEVTASSAAILDKEFSGEYPHRYFSTGLGLMSRLPMRNQRFERSQRGINGFVFAEIVHRGRRIQVANLHLDPLHLWTLPDLATLPFQLRRQRQIQREELTQALQSIIPGKPALLVGDFNRVGNDVIDQLKSLGYVDSFAVIQSLPDAIATLHFCILGIHCGHRIDFIFHDPSFQTHESIVFDGEPSDHDALASRLHLQ
ncbi:MAG: endonuclease/exonuclease/phosphatase family protein [Verrucomicrobiota bacterium]